MAAALVDWDGELEWDEKYGPMAFAYHLYALPHPDQADSLTKCLPAATIATAGNYFVILGNPWPRCESRFRDDVAW